MGQEGVLADGPRRILVHAAACEPIATVEVLRNFRAVRWAGDRV
jgi:hypothetical protein